MPQIAESNVEKPWIPGAELCPSCSGTRDEPGFLSTAGLRRYCTSPFHQANTTELCSADEGQR